MSATPLVDACVVSGPYISYVHAEAARGVEIQLREEIAKLRAFIDDLDEIGRHSGKTENREWHGEWVPLEVARQLEHKLATAQLDAARYQYLRTLNKREFCALVDDCLYQDLNFDAEVDRSRNQT